jgi:hypothetical protein
MSTSRLPIVGIWGLTVALSACYPCDGTVVENTTFAATLTTADDGDVLSSEITVYDGQSGAFGPGGTWWEAAIGDASTVSPAVGFLVLTSSRRTVFLSLPFPLSVGATLPVVATVSLQSPQSFMFDPGNPGTPPSANAVGAWMQIPWECDRATQDSCRIAQDGARTQSWAATVEVSSVRPQQLRIDATVSYPAASGLAPAVVAGDIRFAVSKSEYCQGNP